MPPTLINLSMRERLRALSLEQLAVVYNLTSSRTVTKFSEHSTAVKRVMLALEATGRDFEIRDENITVLPAQDRELFGDARRIRVLIGYNPKNPGTKSHHRFGLYRDGMTVAQYVEIVRGLGDKRRKAVRDIDWDVDHEFIEAR